MALDFSLFPFLVLRELRHQDRSYAPPAFRQSIQHRLELLRKVPYKRLMQPQSNICAFI